MVRMEKGSAMTRSFQQPTGGLPVPANAPGEIMPPLGAPLSDEDRAALSEAVRQLEHASFAAHLTNLVGQKFSAVGALIPAPARALVSRAVGAALNGALRTALTSLGGDAGPARKGLHKTLAAASGAAGGAFGLPALALELPVSTTLILRSIADIARAQGEDLADPATALACMEVFALGGRTQIDDHMESGYFAVRSVLATTMTEAARYIAQHGVSQQSAPMVVRFLSQIAARFGIVVSQKVAAQALPVIGALGGAAVNYAFTDHFQSIAHGHFTVRRLERLYGASLVRRDYERMANAQRGR